ncbi:hypothetical protein ACFL04_03660 [Patescibacteria group bacterium]
METVRKNTIVVYALLLLGLFITVIIVIIAVDISRQSAPESQVGAPVNLQPQLKESQPTKSASRVFAASGLIEEITESSLIISTTVFVDSEPEERTFTVNIDDSTSILLINRETEATSDLNLSQLSVGDTVTFRSGQNLLDESSITATKIEKLIN